MIVLLFSVVHGARGFLGEIQSPWRSVIATPLGAAPHAAWIAMCIVAVGMGVGMAMEALSRYSGARGEWMVLPVALVSIAMFAAPTLVSLASLARRIARRAPGDFFAPVLEPAAADAMRETPASIRSDAKVLARGGRILLPTGLLPCVAYLAALLILAAAGILGYLRNQVGLLSGVYTYLTQSSEAEVNTLRHSVLGLLGSGTTAAVLPLLAWLFWVLCCGGWRRGGPAIADGRVPLASILAHLRGMAGLLAVSATLAARYVLDACSGVVGGHVETLLAGVLAFCVWLAATLLSFVAIVHAVALGKWPRLAIFLGIMFCIVLVVLEIHCGGPGWLSGTQSFGSNRLEHAFRLVLLAVVCGGVLVNVIPQVLATAARPIGGIGEPGPAEHPA